ncbi:DUF424 family protein [Candidatus Woesearchaeota archaeon]|nr:DUF424 family protein [Candidatus Woesearchaeota archaeon]
MIVKIHKSNEGRVILAVCDSELIGKRFTEGEKQLDMSSDFYKGEEMEEKRILNLLKSVHIVNLCGKESVALGVKAGVVDEENIIKVDGIPHAEGVILREE